MLFGPLASLGSRLPRTLVMLDYCLELSKIKVLKMRDLQTKSAIDSDKLQV